MAEETAPPAERDAIAVASISDTAAAVDTIGFRPYVAALATFLCSERTVPPLVVSVEGRWGSGKTSLMRQLERAVAPSRVRPPFGPGATWFDDRRQWILGLGGRLTESLNPWVRVEPRTVWFNAWRHQKDDELWASFGLEFLTQLRHQTPLWKRPLAALQLFVLRFRWVDGGWDFVRAVGKAIFFVAATAAVAFYTYRAAWAGLLSRLPVSADSFFAKALGFGVAGSSWVAVLALSVKTLRSLAGTFGNPLEVQLSKHLSRVDYAGRSAFVEQFHRDFERIVASYAIGRTDRILVFIDDVDRCDPARAADLMQAINLLVGENRHLVFVIGMDRTKVAAGIALKFHEVVPYLAATTVETNPTVAAVEYAFSYLEKFIQVPFRVPRCVGPGFRQLLRTLTGIEPPRVESPLTSEDRLRIEYAVDRDSKVVNVLLELVAEVLEHNPRRIKQFLNVFRLTAYIADQTGSGALSLAQIAKFVAIDLRWPDFWDDVGDDPAVAQTDPRWESKGDLKALIEARPPDLRGNTELSKPVVLMLREIAPERRGTPAGTVTTSAAAEAGQTTEVDEPWRTSEVEEMGPASGEIEESFQSEAPSGGAPRRVIRGSRKRAAMKK